MIDVEAAKWQAISKALVDAVILINEQGRIEEANPAAFDMFGYTARDLIGQNVSILMPEPYRTEHDDYLRIYRKTRKRHIIGIGREMVAQRKDGVIFPVKLSVGEARYDGSRLFVGVIHDLSETKRNEESLRQAQKVEIIAQLTTGVAHDFNNLLNVIQGNLEMMEQYIHHPEARAILDEVLAAIDDSSQFIKRLLAYGRGQKAHFETVDLDKLVRHFVGFARRSIGERIEINLHLAGDLPHIMIDPAQLEAALLNIILNAADAMNGTGRIDITTHICLRPSKPVSVRNRFVCLDIKDNGRGMSDEILGHIFDPFFTTKPDGLGTGLGLSMVQGFIKQSDGEISIKTALGKGTTVSLIFPAGPD